MTLRTPSAVRTVYAADPVITDIGTSVIQTGNTYNYWGTGELDKQTSLANGQKHYIATAAQLPELADYKGDSTITTMWIQEPDGSTYTIPVYMDETGIYFTPTNSINNLPAGTSFKFTQSLILGT
jgi:hypothetical protein